MKRSRVEVIKRKSYAEYNGTQSPTSKERGTRVFRKGQIPTGQILILGQFTVKLPIA